MNREINREDLGACSVLSRRANEIAVGHAIGKGVVVVIGELSFVFLTAEDAEVFAADFTDAIRLAWPERGN